MKTIMILGGSILQLPAIEKAINMGLRVVVVDKDPKAIGFNVNNVIKENISTTDIPRVCETAKFYNIDGIMTLASDMPVRTIAKVSSEMGLIGIDEKSAYKATNKIAMRRALAANHVPIPLFFEVLNEDDYIKAIKELKKQGLEVIVKPADNSGSRGVYYLTDFSEISLKKVYSYCKSFSQSGAIIVEEYMEGQEISVETLALDGEYEIVQITDKETTGYPYFVEMGHSQPSILPDDIKEQVKKITIMANKAVGIKNGASHTEIKITKKGAKIVEIGARLGGDNITTHLVPLSTGVDMVECCIKIALGEKPDWKHKYNKGAAIRYLKAGMGKIKEIKGVDLAEKLQGVKQISFVHGVGEINGVIKSSNDRIGFVVGQSNTANEAIEICNKAIGCIDIVVEEINKKG